jgi:hypothetical protein
MDDDEQAIDANQEVHTGHVLRAKKGTRDTEMNVRSRQ